MTIPTIHMNGTGRESLIEGLCEASQSLELAYSALKQTAPNGRDYYPQGPDAVYAAEAEHTDRLTRLDAIKTEIDELTLAIDEAGRRPKMATCSLSSIPMLAIELLKMLDEQAKVFRRDRQYFERNRHMHDMRPTDAPPQEVVDAILTGFVNHIGSYQGIDYALYASDLSKPSVPAVTEGA